VTSGSSLSVGLFAPYRSPPTNFSVTTVAAIGVSNYLFTGPVEELAFRGYFQNKLTALFGGSTASGSRRASSPLRSCSR
jgi:membrane protease YdiL (CAAX protease family)